MRSRTALWPIGFVLLFTGAIYAWEKPFRQYRSLEGYDAVELPKDFAERTEWVQARLMYPQHPNSRFARHGRAMDWKDGGTSWSQDYPRADRHFAQAVRRLTRVHSRSAEQPVDPDDADDIYDWPWLVAGEMGDWKLTPTQIQTVREYLLRGGFLMLDDFWGSEEWNRFNETMSQIFPDRVIVEIPDNDASFHLVYDIDEKFTIPGQWGMRRPCLCRNDGEIPHWRGIYDDKGRLMVAMAFNNDIGDSWEWADDAGYPEKYSSLGIKIGVNYVVYALTH